VVTEEEVLRAVLARHGAERAEKFIQEVCWRTYWKGWLEMRPDIWTRLQADLEDLDHDARHVRAAREGRTGIDCFDAWAGELVETGWLHNHARMWFASIWIFTLRLPWQLGAAFFADHLLDFDPASNTLSWRWVAGLHTRGKHYLARADNIAKNTNGRFNPKGQLDERAMPLEPDAEPAKRPLRALKAAPDSPGLGVLITSEDLSDHVPTRFAYRSARAILRDPAKIADSPAAAFASACTDDAARRLDAPVITDIGAWAAAEGLDAIVTAEAPVGPVRDMLARSPVPVFEVRRPYDADAWPHATHGFFRFKEAIPRLLAAHAG
jgi:deoxyribodipyrimidine photo-lyase